MEFTFRPVTNDDLELLHRWLNDPGIVRWWEGDDVSWDGVVKTYGQPRDDGTEHWLGLLDGREVGWIQCVPANSNGWQAREWAAIGIDTATTGEIDYLVGDPSDRSRGVGSAMIDGFVREVVFADHPQWAVCAASPHVDNIASWRALERAGFTRVDDVVADDGTWRVMRRLRRDG